MNSLCLCDKRHRYTVVKVVGAVSLVIKFLLIFELPRWRLGSVKTIGAKIDFSGNPIAELTAHFSFL